MTSDVRRKHIETISISGAALHRVQFAQYIDLNYATRNIEGKVGCRILRQKKWRVISGE